MESFGVKKEVDPRIRGWKNIIENLSDYESSKGVEEIFLIDEANKKSSMVIEDYGFTPPALTEDKVHLIKKEWWQDGHAFFSREHGIFVCESDDLDLFRTAVIHEMFHYKGVNFLPIPLTEAIVERLTNQAINIDDKSLQGNAVFSGIYTYDDYRLQLDKLLKILSGKIDTESRDVFTFFAKAHLGGSLEHLSVLDAAFGSGTTEKLNKLDDDPESLGKFIDGLK